MQLTNVAMLIAVATVAVYADEGKERAFKFSKDDIGKVPKGWKAEKTGRGEGSVWKVVEDDTAPSKSGVALAQTAKSPGGVFNICVAEDTNYKDVELSVSFKAVAASEATGRQRPCKASSVPPPPAALSRLSACRSASRASERASRRRK